MSHEWDSGFMVNKPSWHRLERAVLKDSPRSWEEARQQAELMWDVDTEPVFTALGEPMIDECEHFLPSDQCEECETRFVDEKGFGVVRGWQTLRRDDTKDVLSIQPNSYQVVRNADFGGVIDALLGIEGDERVTFEALMSLYGGRMIVALCYFETPLQMSWDPSKTYTFLAFASRHDGSGGLRGIPTNVRVQCANTMNMAEALDGRTVGFSIRHTSNWEQRVAELRADLVAARGDSREWITFTEQLALWKVGEDQVDRYLKQMFPVSDAMTPRMATNQQANRSKVRENLASDSCTGIADNGYGLLMATTEWADHGRRSLTTSSHVGRQLLRKEEPKTRAASILREMADISL